MLEKYLSIAIILVSFWIPSVSSGQIKLESDKSLARKYGNQIDTVSIRADITRLSSAEFMGRETAELGQKRAAQFIRQRLIDSQLSPAFSDTGYVQPYTLYKTLFKEGFTVVDDDTLIMLKHFYSFSSITDSTISSDELLFLGYGISDEGYDNYASKDVKGKAAIIFNGEPMRGDISRISGSVIPTLWSDGYDSKLELAREKGISVLFVVQEYFDKNLPRVTYYLGRPKLTLERPSNSALPIVFISPEMVNELLPEYGISGVRNALESEDAVYDISRQCKLEFSLKKDVETVQAENLAGIVRGKLNPQEYIVISAHYDHLGMKDSLIFFGADDNGSGTSTNLELMRIFAKAEREGNGPDRSILFLFVSGEEKGLLGSSFFADNTVIPIENMVANLNVDMIGRTDASLTDTQEQYVYLIGSDRLSTELHEISEQVNRRFCDLRLDYKFNDPNDPQRLYYRSDHYNFAKNGIPVIFYFRGLHEDYHKPTDTVEKIEFDAVDRIAKLIFFTAWELSNRKLRIKVDEALD